MNNGKEEASLLCQSDKVANRVGQTTIRSKRALIKKAPGQSHRDQMVPISAPAILLSRSFVYHHVICLISFLSLSLSLFLLWRLLVAKNNRKRDWLGSGWPKPLQAPRSFRRNGPSSRVCSLKSPDWAWTARTAGPAVATSSTGCEKRTSSSCSTITCCAAWRRPR